MLSSEYLSNHGNWVTAKYKISLPGGKTWDRSNIALRPKFINIMTDFWTFLTVPLLLTARIIQSV
jgi:hypothetical protein